MAARDIVFSAPMVLALLDGRKTQTRQLSACLALHLKRLEGCTAELDLILAVEPDGAKMQARRINQRCGPAIKFLRALIARNEFEIRGARDRRLVIWQTQCGSLGTISITDEETRAEIVEPGEELTMRCVVMDAFNWHDRARSMVRDQLKWKLVRAVE